MQLPDHSDPPLPEGLAWAYSHRNTQRLNNYDLIETLADVMLVNGIPEHIRSDNGPEFVALKLRKWLSSVGAKTMYIDPEVGGRTD